MTKGKLKRKLKAARREVRGLRRINAELQARADADALKECTRLLRGTRK